MTEPIQHPFPAVEQWINELQSAEKDFREVLEKVARIGNEETDVWLEWERQLREIPVASGFSDLAEDVRRAREVLAKHPAMRMEV